MSRFRKNTPYFLRRAR